MRTFTPSARAVAVVAAVICGATAVPSSTHADTDRLRPRELALFRQQADPCAPLGTLEELELNDRCDYGTEHPDTVEAPAIIAGLARSGLFATTIDCLGTDVPVVARPNELLITAGSPVGLAAGLVALRQRIGDVIESVRPLNALAALVSVTPGIINDVFLRFTIPTLQGERFSVDLNYLEPAQPNNSFRPGDDPVLVLPPGPMMGRGGRGHVLVVDSPSEPDAHPIEKPDVVVSSIGPSVTYDVDGNGLVDEDHGHGTFVASLLKRMAPRADVVLAGVTGQQLPSARWTPMMFSDADLINALDAAFGLSTLGRTTRRTFNVVNLSLGGAGCDGVAARLALGRFMRDLAVIASNRGARPIYVAAAGNDGGDVKHYPAAFRDKDTMGLAALAIDVTVGVAAGNAVRQLHADFLTGMVAVGSWTANAPDSFSNCGVWVNAVASGFEQVSRYRSPSTWARWSGTSFATPRVSAALVGGVGLTDVVRDTPPFGQC